MNILFINHMGFLGGGEKSMLALMDGLRQDNKNRTFLLAQPGELTERAREMDFPVYEYVFSGIKRTANLLFWLAGIFRFKTGVNKILKIITENNIGIVHANSLKAAIMGGLAARRAGIPLVFHTRDFLPAGIWRGLLVAWAYRLSDRIIANSQSVAQLYGKDPKNKVTVVYNHVEQPKFPKDKTKADIRIEHGCAAGEILIGYSGRLHPAKGIETLLSGFKIIRGTVPEARLWLVGGAMPGEERYTEELKRYAEKLGILDQSVFFGWRKDALELMACFDLTVVPSQKEPFGRVTVEAMMLGIPVVATASGGTLEIIENNKTGLLFSPCDSRQLAEKCREIISDPEKTNRMIRLAKSEVGRKFSAENYIGGVQKVYASLAGE